MDHHGTSRTHTRMISQPGYRLRGHPPQGATDTSQDLLAEAERRPASHPCPQDDGKELGRTEGRCPMVFEPLARALEARQLTNT
jgi:hypothetical protein